MNYYIVYTLFLDSYLMIFVNIVNFLVKGKVYRTVMRPAMMSGLETVAIGRRQEAELEVAEQKMLRISLGVTRVDKIRNAWRKT